MTWSTNARYRKNRHRLANNVKGFNALPFLKTAK
jgi:hypothetical protein